MQIYTLNINEYTFGRQSVGLNTSDTEPLGGRATTDGISSEVASWSVDADWTGAEASRRARELLELAGSLGHQPLAVSDAPPGLDGYWLATRGSREPRRAETERQNASERVSLDVDLMGTRKTHWIAVATSPSQPDPGHEFGNDLDALVGIPAAATRVRAVDTTTEPSEQERPTPVDTVSAEHGDVDIYDVDAIDIDAPTLLYDLPYQRQGDVDVGVWDTYGHEAILDADDVVAWGRVFATDHEFSGAGVIENGLLRLRIDEPDDVDETAALEAESWDADADTWSPIALPEYPGDLETDWQPVDVDVTRIGQARVAARVAFEAVGGVDAGEWATVGLHLDRGAERVWVREVAGSIPSSLMALLEPIASTTILDAGVTQSIVAREDLFRGGGA